MRTPSRLPSASKLHLAFTCAASQVLPVVDTAWEAGEGGKEKHAALAAHLAGLPLSDTSDATAAWLSEFDEDTLAPLVGSADEAAYALDVATGKGRLLGHRLERAYGEAKDGEIFGSADYVKVDRPADLVAVVDLKTGLADVPHPSRNPQLRFLALAAATAHGVSSARGGILKAPEGQSPRWSWATFDAFELEVIASELRSLVERIGYARNDVQRGKTPRLTVGEHCNHCPARFGCPARVAMAKRLAGEPEAVVMDLKAMLTPENASMALARWKAARKAIEEVGGALYAYAKENPIAVGDGRVWGPVESSREVIDAEKAWEVLEAKYGPRIARAAMKWETSKAGVDRAMHALRESARGAPQRPIGIPEGKITIKGLNEDALKALRDAGAVTTKTVTEYEEHAPRLRAAYTGGQLPPLLGSGS